MKITATKIKAKELSAGDLFSTARQEYWDNIGTNYSIGERVFIRTETKCPQDQEEVDVYKITIRKDG